jgi:ATP-dependent Clp protease adaptor protein ClpS
MSQEQQLPSTRSRAKKKVETPPLFKVLMHNDDYTTMEFVVEVLCAVFHQSDTAAERIMLAIHFQGVGHCGTYPFAVAETKVQEVRSRARKAGFPLRCSIEKE